MISAQTCIASSVPHFHCLALVVLSMPVRVFDSHWYSRTCLAASCSLHVGASRENEKRRLVHHLLHEASRFGHFGHVAPLASHEAKAGPISTIEIWAEFGRRRSEPKLSNIGYWATGSNKFDRFRRNLADTGPTSAQLVASIGPAHDLTTSGRSCAGG